MDYNFQTDWQVEEIRALEIQATNTSDKHECQSLIVKAAQLCQKTYLDWKCPPVRRRLHRLLIHIVRQGETIKDAKPDQTIKYNPYTFPLTDITPLYIHNPKPAFSNLTSNKAEIFRLQASKFGNNKFPPWPTNDFNSNALNKNPKMHPPLSLSPVQQKHFAEWSKPLPSSLQTEFTQSNLFGTSVDLVQDVGPDCSVIASICAFMAQPEIADNILSSLMYPPPNIDSDRYFFKFYFNGCERAVEVDSKLPASKSERFLFVIDSQNSNLLWPAYLEKAYLTLLGGYDIPGSISTTDLNIMTGWIPEWVEMQEEGVKEDRLWPKLWEGFHSKSLIATFGTRNISKEAQDHYGLIPNHAYALLDLKREAEVGYALLKNPWRDNETIWPKADKGSSTFWIPFVDLRTWFKSAYLNWYPGIFDYRKDIDFVWSIARSTITLCDEKTPQFTLKRLSNGASNIVTWILLTRHLQDINESTSARYASGHISLWVTTKKSGNKIYEVDDSLISSRSIDAMSTLVRIILGPDQICNIIPRQQGASIGDHRFTLSAFSNSPMSLNHAEQPLSYTVELQGEWLNGLTAFGSIDEQDFYKNPQYSFELGKSTHLAMSLESWNADTLVNVMIYFSGEQIFTVKSIAIALGNTEYSAGRCMIQTKHAPLLAGKYTVLVSTYKARQETPFTIHCESDHPITFRRINGEERRTNVFKPPRASFGSDVNILAIPFHVKTRYSAKFRVLALYAPTNPLGVSRNEQQSPISLSIECGTGPHKEIIAETGTTLQPYVDAPKQGLRLMNIKIDGPEKNYTYWLVIQRINATRPKGNMEFWDLSMIEEGTTKDIIQLGQGWIIREE